MHIKIAGHAEWDVFGLSVKQDATPVDASESFGGTGSFSFAIPEDVDAKALSGAIVEVIDGDHMTLGVIAAISGDGYRATATASTILNPLVARRNAGPHVGTIGSYLTYLFGLAGLPAPTVVAEAADQPVVTIGWSEDLWRQVKAFLVAQRLEIDVVDGVVVVRPYRTERASRLDQADYRWSVDESRMAERVEAWYYEKAPVAGALLVGNGQSAVSNLGAGEVLEYRIPLEYSLSSVQQPVPVGSVAYGYTGSSVYAVVDRFGKTVKPSYWLKQGGAVSVSIGDDSRSITVRVTGCLDVALAPYRFVGVRDMHGQPVEYSTLRIVGSGVAFKRKKYSMPACVDGSATEEVGVEFDSPFVDSWGHAHYLLRWAAVKYGTPTVRVTGTARLGAGAGARLRDDFAEYRVRTLSRGASGVARFEAEFDTTMGDVEDVWVGKTLGDFEDAHTTVAAFDVNPLKT